MSVEASSSAAIQPESGKKPDAARWADFPVHANERNSSAQRMIGFHDFRYPDAQFRIAFFAGASLPQAQYLVHRAYARLGYRQLAASQATTTVSLQAVHRDATLGTLCVNLGSVLHAEALYPDEVDKLRRRGTLCEFTQLALDTDLAGREVLCSLFYVAYVFSHMVRQAKHLLIEVNPRHRHFYQRMLGFTMLGEERICHRVGAPAVLLHLDFEFTREQMARARLGLSVAGTNLYRYAAPLAEEQALIRQFDSAVL